MSAQPNVSQSISFVTSARYVAGVLTLFWVGRCGVQWTTHTKGSDFELSLTHLSHWLTHHTYSFNFQTLTLELHNGFCCQTIICKTIMGFWKTSMEHQFFTKTSMEHEWVFENLNGIYHCLNIQHYEYLSLEWLWKVSPTWMVGDANECLCTSSAHLLLHLHVYYPLCV
jgi:hypothetical protein